MWDWKVDNSPGAGFVAQELVEVVPDAVLRGDDNDEIPEEGYQAWAVDMSKIMPYVVAGLKETMGRVSALEKMH